MSLGAVISRSSSAVYCSLGMGGRTRESEGCCGPGVPVNRAGRNRASKLPVFQRARLPTSSLNIRHPAQSVRFDADRPRGSVPFPGVSIKAVLDHLSLCRHLVHKEHRAT